MYHFLTLDSKQFLPKVLVFPSEKGCKTRDVDKTLSSLIFYSLNGFREKMQMNGERGRD